MDIKIKNISPRSAESDVYRFTVYRKTKGKWILQKKAIFKKQKKKKMDRVH